MRKWSWFTEYASTPSGGAKRVWSVRLELDLESLGLGIVWNDASRHGAAGAVVFLGPLSVDVAFGEATLQMVSPRRFSWWRHWSKRLPRVLGWSAKYPWDDRLLQASFSMGGGTLGAFVHVEFGVIRRSYWSASARIGPAFVKIDGTCPWNSSERRFAIREMAARCES